MKKTLITAITLLTIPTTAAAWRDPYYDEERAIAAQRQALAIESLVNELKYQQEYREYQIKIDQWNQRNEDLFGGEGSAMGPYFPPPSAPRR